MMTSVLTGTGIVCGGLAIWTGIEQNLLLVRRKTIFLKRLPPEFDGFTILQLSDLHKRELGDCNSRIIQQVRLLQPRLVALTGDLISRDCRDFSRTGIFLRELSAACPHVYACLGNHELDLPPAVWETLRHTLSGAGIRLLDNETVILPGRRFALSGWHPFKKASLQTGRRQLPQSGILLRSRADR